MALFFGLFALMFISTQALQSVMGYDPFAAGLRLVPLPALFAVFAQVSVRLARRVGTRPVVTVGLAIAAVGLATGATLDAESGYGVLAVALSLTGIGMGCTMAPATAPIMGSVPRDRARRGGGERHTRLTAGAIGVAVVGSLLSAASNHALSGGAAATLPARRCRTSRDIHRQRRQVSEQAGGRTGEQILALATGGLIDGASGSSPQPPSPYRGRRRLTYLPLGLSPRPAPIWDLSASRRRPDAARVSRRSRDQRPASPSAKPSSTSETTLRAEAQPSSKKAREDPTARTTHAAPPRTRHAHPSRPPLRPLRDRSLGGRRRHIFTQLAARSGARPGDRALDIGCGTGYLTRGWPGPSPPTETSSESTHPLRSSTTHAASPTNPTAHTRKEPPPPSTPPTNPSTS